MTENTLIEKNLKQNRHLNPNKISPNKQFELYRVKNFAQAGFNVFISTYLTLFLLMNTTLTKWDIGGLILITQLLLLIKPIIRRALDKFLPVWLSIQIRCMIRN